MDRTRPSHQMRSILDRSILDRTWIVPGAYLGLDRADFRRCQVGAARSLRGLDGLDRRRGGPVVTGEG